MLKSNLITALLIVGSYCHFKSLPNDKSLDCSKMEILFGSGRKYCGKTRKCWLPAFSPFPTMF